MLPAEEEDALEPLRRLLDGFASRLPEGEREDDVRRALARTQVALHELRGVEDAVRELVTSLHQLDEDIVGGRRREFQRNAPAVGRLLEAIQEDLLPMLRRSGYQV
jgi:hypothetical protein